MATILDDILGLSDSSTQDTVTENRAPQPEELSLLQKAAATARGIRQLGVNTFINFPTRALNAVSPVDLSGYLQPLLDKANENYGAVEADTGKVPAAPQLSDIHASLAEPHKAGLLDIGIPPGVETTKPSLTDRIDRLLGATEMFKTARKRSDTGIGAAAKTFSEVSGLAPLSQRIDVIPDIPGVYDEERKKESEIQKLERLPESIAQASMLYSTIAGGIGLFKGKAKPVLGMTKNTLRQVEKDAGIMNELAKQKIVTSITENLEVYTPDGKGKVAQVVGLDDIKNGLSSSAKKKYVKGIEPKDKRFIVELNDGRTVGYKPEHLIVDPKSVMEATGMKPGRLLVDPVRLKSLIDDEVGALDPQTTGKFLNDVIRTAGPALASKVGQLMKDRPGMQVMEAVGRAIAQGEAPEVQITALSKLYKIPIDKAAEMAAQNFKVAGEMIANGDFTFNRRGLANMMEITSMMDPEIASQLHRTARDLYLENPVTRGRFGRASATWKELKDGGMLGSAKGFMRDFRSSLTRGTVIQGMEDLLTDITVGVGNPITQKIFGVREAAGLPTKDLSQVFANTLGTVQAIGLGGLNAISHVKDFAKLPFNPEFRKWVTEASYAELKGEPVPPHPKGLRTRTSLDAVLDLAKEFPEKYQDLNRSIGGDSFVNMMAIDQIARASQAVKNARRTFNFETGGNAILQGLKAGANTLTAGRAMADIGIKRIAVGAKLLTYMNKSGKTLEQLMGELKSTKALDPVTEAAFADAFSHGRDVTYSNRFEGSPAATILEQFRKYPILHTITQVEYPGFHFNKLNYLWERNPIRAGLSMIKPDNLRKLAGEIDPVELQANLNHFGITDPGSPKGLAISKALREKGMEHAGREFARFFSGMAQITMAGMIRQSKYAGPRYHEVDKSTLTGEVGPNGERQIESLNYDEPLSTWLGVAEAIEATHKGIPLNDVFTKGDLLNLAVGTKTLNNTSIFALDKIAEVFDREAEATGPAAGKVATDLLDNELSKFFGFMRQLKDVSALTDMRKLGFEGSDEMLIPDQKQTAFPQILGTLPNGLRSREWLVPTSGKTSSTIFETDGIRKRDASVKDVLFGITYDKQIPLQRFMGATGLNISDAVGQGFPDPVMDKVHTYLFNRVLQSQLGSGLTVGNAIILYANDLATKAANSTKPEITILDETFPIVGPRTAVFHEVRRYVAQEAFASIRGDVRDATIAEFAKSDPERLNKFVEQQYPRIVRPAIREFFETLKKERRAIDEHE